MVTFHQQCNRPYAVKLNQNALRYAHAARQQKSQNHTIIDNKECISYEIREQIYDKKDI